MVIFQPDRFLLNEEIKAVKDYIHGDVLDVGAGEFNRYSGHFKHSKYVRLDTSHGSKVDLVGSADKIPADSESFDSVVCTQVFEHLEFPEKSAKEIYRVLKHGGHLLVTVPQMNELHEEPHDYWRYTKFGLKSLFEHAGFEEVHIEQRGGYYSTLAQMRIRHLIDSLDLYKRTIIGKMLGPFISIYGRLAIKRDELDNTRANRKHTIGWCAIYKKR